MLNVGDLSRNYARKVRIRVFDVGAALTLKHHLCSRSGVPHITEILAYKSLLQAVPEAGKIISAATDLATFFHKSSAQTTELRQLAEARQLKVLQLPKTFYIIFCQLSANILDAVLLPGPRSLPI